MIAADFESVRHRIARCCEKAGRDPASVSLVCVTKTAAVDEIREAVAAGARILGENRVQDALVKMPQVGGEVSWHLIGHLQTNKARDAVRAFSLIHSIDSARLAGVVNREAGKAGKVQDILLQVNVAGEDTKFGARPAELPVLVDAVQQFPHLRLRGLMTIAPLVDDPEEVRPVFRRLRELRDAVASQLNTKYYVPSARVDGLELSMGMTDDFEVAIEEGATIVRVGRAIFRGQGSGSRVQEML